MRHLILFFVVLLFLGSCKRSTVKSGASGKVPSVSVAVNHAHGFSIRYMHDTTHIAVHNPWQHASNIEYNYYLGNNLKSQFINEYTWQIKTPVNRVICLSTTHIGFIDFLHKTETIYGISGKIYVVNEKVRSGIDNNTVFDVGYDENLNYEMILKLNPDVVFAYGVSVSVTNVIKKLNELGIPVILIGEYLEPDPLAKMEWVKVFSACYDLNDQTMAAFDSVVSSYESLKMLAAKDNNKPAVLLGLPWRGTWYVSGAQSYIARLIKDAGGSYIWQNMDYNESRPMGLEKIYEKALAADYWINPGEARSTNDILSVDERFGMLPCVVNDKIYNNDNQLTPLGGNDFYETGVVEPDVILSDLICILHPQLLPSHKLKYYRKLQKTR